MNIVSTIILGIVEGITEFLPISSTAHLIITSKLLNISQTEFQKFFEVFIQSGAILAVVFIYFNYTFKNKELMKKVVISFIPTAIVGFLLHKIIKTIFFNSFNLIIGSLFFIGLLFIIFEYLVKSKKIILKKNLNQLTILDTIVIGLAQSLAVVPGVSRAGIVMLAMMGRGFKREESAIYSFLLAVPTLLAASTFDFIKTDYHLIFSGSNPLFLIIGLVVSFFSALLAVKWFISFLQKKSLSYFGVYRIVLALMIFFAI